MIDDSTLARLKQILQTHSIRRGDFVLASGQHSNIYVDARLTTLRAEAMPLIGRAFLDKMRERGWHPAAIGGLTMGADPVVTAVAREALEFGTVINAFLVRKKVKDHGRQGYIVGIDDAKGLDVVVVDDVCTTGGSTVVAIDRAREAGMNVLGAICLVDREQGGKKSIEEKSGRPFEQVFTMSELLEEETET